VTLAWLLKCQCRRSGRKCREGFNTRIMLFMWRVRPRVMSWGTSMLVVIHVRSESCPQEIRAEMHGRFEKLERLAVEVCHCICSRLHQYT